MDLNEALDQTKQKAAEAPRTLPAAPGRAKAASDGPQPTAKVPRARNSASKTGPVAKKASPKLAAAAKKKPKRTAAKAKTTQASPTKTPRPAGRSTKSKVK
jgi:hypothetical protein